MSDEQNIDAPEENVDAPEDQVEDTQLDDTQPNSEEATDSEESVPEEDGEATEEVPEEIQKEVLKVLGKEIEVDHEELVRLAQKGMGADQKFFEASKQRDELLQVFNDLRDPTKVVPLLQQMGLDTRKLMEDYLTTELDKEQMTPEQKKLVEYQQKEAAWEAEKRKMHAEKENKELAAQNEQIREEYDKQFSEALESVELPKTAESVAKMAYYMEAALGQGSEISAKDAAMLVKDDYTKGYKDFGEKATVEQLISMFGEGIVKKFQNYDLSKIKSPEDGNTVKKETKQKSTPGKKSKKMEVADFRNFLNSRFGGDPYDENWTP